MTSQKGLLLRGGTIVDGSGKMPYQADMRLRDGRIAEIGPRLATAGEDVLDIGGAHVTPGFIDSHTHLDSSVFWDASCDPLPLHGVTTAVMGNCSLTLAPIRPRDRNQIVSVFSYIEDMPYDVMAGSIPWAWTTWPEYRDTLRAGQYGLNLSALVGHTPIRQYVMGDQAWERAAHQDERRQIARMLDLCLEAGAVGLSTSLFDSDAQGRPVPSVLADDEEFDALLRVLAKRGALLTFIPNVAIHAALLADVDRMAGLCARHGVVATWNGLFHDDRRPERADEIVAQATGIQGAGGRVYPQVSPRRIDVRINWSGGMAFYSLPPWHQVVQAAPADKRRMLADEGWRQAARDAWDGMTRTLIRHHEHDRIKLVSVARPELREWVGSSLAALIAARGGHPSDVLADWVLDNDCDPGVVGTGVMNADPEGVASLLTHPATIISNGDAGAHVQMMCGAGDTTLLLTRHVRDRADFPLARAVWEITARQAELYGISNRGRLRVGYAADVVVFDLPALTWHEAEFVDDLPNGVARLRRPSGGYEYTIVAGDIVQWAGQVTGALPGRMLLHRR